MVPQELIITFLLGIAAIPVAIGSVSLPLAFPKANPALHKAIFFGCLASSAGLIIAAVLVGRTIPSRSLEMLLAQAPATTLPKPTSALPSAPTHHLKKTPAPAESAAVPPSKSQPIIPLQSAPEVPPQPYGLSTEQQKRLLALVLPLKATLPKMVISRSAVPGGDQIMMQLAQVFERGGFQVVTGFQDVKDPSQTGLFVCVPDTKHIPAEALQLKAALREIGFDAPLIQLPSDATQNAVVIFAGPLPL